MKKLLVKIVYFVLMTVLIIGTVSISGVMAAEKATLTVWDWHTSEIPEVLGKLYQEFEAKNNVKLNIVASSFSDLYTKYVLSGKAGALPDVGEINGGLLPEFAEEGWVEPLDSYIEREGGEKYLEMYADWAIPRYKGKVYALMVLSGAMAMYWNKTMFAEAGIQGPPKTWQELIDVSQKLTNPSRSRYGLALNGKDAEAFSQSIAPFVYQSGGRIGKIDGKYQVNNPEAIEGIQFLLDLISKYEVVPSYSTTGLELVTEMFSGGGVGMFINASWDVPIVAGRNPDFEWATAVLPKGKFTGSALGGWDTCYAMFTNCKDKELGWKFVKFMTSEESNYYWISKAGAYLSAVNSVRSEMASLPLLAPFMEQASLPNFYNPFAYMPKKVVNAGDMFNIEMHSAILGMKTTQEAMDDLVEKWIELDEEWEEEYGG